MEGYARLLSAPQLTAVVNVINGPLPGSYLSSMILYLPPADNVRNKGAGAFPSPALPGHARD
jgi:hypothetical protein